MKCNKCSGTGRIPRTHTHIVPNSNGRVTTQTVRNSAGIVQTLPCSKCNGTGKIVKE